MVLTTVGAVNTVQHMARKLRVEYLGAIYHVMIRGDRREETMGTIKWIGERLAMGTAGYVNHRLSSAQGIVEVKAYE